MNVLKVDHIGVAVKNLDAVLKFYEENLGMHVHGTEENAEQQVKVGFVPVGDTEIEFLESISPAGAIAKFIEKNGEGIQHIALRVDNIEQALQELKDKGVKLLNEQPRIGAGGSKIAFIHPKSTFGTLVELCEQPKK